MTAAAIGGVLWAAGGVAVWLRPDRSRPIAIVYALGYILALIIFSAAVAPAIWGPFRCATMLLPLP